MAEDLHIVMVPWLAFSHMIPFLQLSMSLAKYGIRISFICTPKNIQRLPKVPPELASLINLVEFSLPVVDGLPEGAKATVDISMEEAEHLKTAYDLLHYQFKQFVANEEPDWIIHDFAPYWITEIAREFGIPQVMFLVFSAAAIVFMGPPESLTSDGQKKYRPSPESMTSPPEWITFPSSVAFCSHEANDFFSLLYGQSASRVTNGDRMALTVAPCQAMAIRSCTEYEGDYLNLADKIYRKPVILIGLLPPIMPPENNKRAADEGEWVKIFMWLDGQLPNSVVLVGFGSDYKLSRDQVYEIAHGLELSNLPFLWAMRRPTWAIDDDDALPSDFKRRTGSVDAGTGGRGVVCMGWAPQLKILAHPSIGGSLFHSGWGSIIETLQFGHVLVVLPLGFEQGLNARLLVENGLAVEVEKSEDGSFKSRDISKALRLAMVDKESESLRDRAIDARAFFNNQRLHQDHYIGGFVQYLKKHM